MKSTTEAQIAKPDSKREVIVFQQSLDSRREEINTEIKHYKAVAAELEGLISYKEDCLNELDAMESELESKSQVKSKEFLDCFDRVGNKVHVGDTVMFPPLKHIKGINTGKVQGLDKEVEEGKKRSFALG